MYKRNTQQQTHTQTHTIHNIHTYAQLASHASNHAGEGKGTILQARVQVHVKARVPTDD